MSLNEIGLELYRYSEGFDSFDILAVPLQSFGKLILVSCSRVVGTGFVVGNLRNRPPYCPKWFLNVCREGRGPESCE